MRNPTMGAQTRRGPIGRWKRFSCGLVLAVCTAGPALAFDPTQWHLRYMTPKVAFKYKATH